MWAAAEPGGNDVVSWDSLWFGVFVNVLSAALVLVAGWVLLAATKRRHLIEFFALKDGITLYTSSLNVHQGGAADWQGVTRSYRGGAIPVDEAVLIGEFEREISAFSSFRVLKIVRVNDIPVRSGGSPLEPNRVDRIRTIMSLGSPGYNTASHIIQTEFEPLGRFAPDLHSVIAPGAPAIEGLDPTVVSTRGIAVRARHPTTGQIAFYAAGPSVIATLASARLLLEHWQRLRKEYPGTTPFCLVVQAHHETGNYSAIHRTPEPRKAPWRLLVTGRLRT